MIINYRIFTRLWREPCVKPRSSKNMAIHNSIPSMLQESLIEMIAVADYCISFRKDHKSWGSHGCYGYPGAILLFSIADSIGSYILGGIFAKNHFKILNHPDYYNLGLTRKEINIIYKNYRCLLTHNSVMPMNHLLDIGTIQDPVFEYKNNMPCINVTPFLGVSKDVVIKFLENDRDVVMNSQTLKKILSK